MKKSQLTLKVLIGISIMFHSVGLFAQSVKTEHEIRFQNWMNTQHSISLMPSTATLGNIKLVLPPLMPSLSDFLTVGEINGNIVSLAWRQDDLISKYGFLGDENSFVGTTNSEPLKFFTNSTERFRITESGKVGIGTDSPSSIFEINGSEHTILTAPSAAIEPDSLEENQITFYVDELNANNQRIAQQAKTADGTTIFGKSLTKVIYHTVVRDVARVYGGTANNSYIDEVFTVSGAQVDDLVVVNCKGDLPRVIAIVSAWVSSANQVTVRFINHYGSTGTPHEVYSDPPSLTYIFLILR